MHENFRIWPYARKKYLLLFFIMQEKKLFGKKLISQCNKITKISLRGICQTHL
jgi:hypothetical protein